MGEQAAYGEAAKESPFYPARIGKYPGRYKKNQVIDWEEQSTQNKFSGGPELGIFKFHADLIAQPVG